MGSSLTVTRVAIIAAEATVLVAVTAAATSALVEVVGQEGVGGKTLFVGLFCFLFFLL